MAIAERHRASQRRALRLACSPIRLRVGDFSRTGPRRDSRAWRGVRFSGSVISRSGALALLRHADAAAAKVCVHPDEHPGRAVVRAQAQDQLPAVFDQPPGAVDELLHHGLDAPALGAVAHRGVGQSTQVQTS